MYLEVGKEGILKESIRQLNSFFSVSEIEINVLGSVMDNVLGRCEFCFSKTENKYYSREGKVYFNPFHSGQYTIFLYYLSNSVFFSEEDSRILADKIYYLNKIMNGCDLYYEVELPEIFMLDHPVGSVLGRAKYENYFSFGQNCTVGNNRGIYPIIGKNVKMAGNSMILGNSNIGENTIIGAGACVKDQDIPANSLVFGQSPNLIIKNR